MRFPTLVLGAFAALASAQSTFNPLRPPSLPLADKSPYMSTWQAAGSDGGNGGYLAGQWPTFWAGQVTGWTGYIRVDNITYVWMGDPAVSPYTNYYVTQTNYQYTPTRSIFTMDVAGVVGMNITFLSPVLPDTLVEMSLPYSYMEVDVSSIDGKKHDVQLYTDISAEWVSGDHTANAQWTYGTSTTNPEPEAFGPVSSATFPASTAITTYGTQTSIDPHPTVPHHQTTQSVAAGQGNHYPGVKSPPVDAAIIPTNVPAVLNKKPGGVAYHEVWRQQQLEFSEINQQANWGYWYYATANTKDLTYQSGEDVVVRGQFIKNGYLADTQDTDYRPIDDDFPVFGFATDMGTVTKKSKSVVFQISLHQQNCVQFEGASGNVSVPCLWTQYFANNVDAMAHFYNSYNDIASASTTWDNKIHTDSNSVDTSDGQNYYSLTALAFRQAFGTLEYTNTATNPWIFMKEISSGGDVQTVDVIYPMHPLMIYSNATLLKFLLEPLFINQETGDFFPMYAEHDLGAFPNATGYNDGNTGEQQPVEECGNMLIMSLAYAQRTGDNAFLAENYGLLHQWNEFLVEFSKIPQSQLSTDDFLGPLVNDSNLALKGIIGIEAMAQIANLTGHTKDGQNFTQIAHNYIHFWYNNAVNYNSTPQHEEAEYNTPASADLLYNLYADAELGTQLVKQEIYNIQSRYYPTVFNEYGVPLRNIGINTVDTKTDWELFCAAIASEGTKNQFISIVANWLDQTPTNRPFSDEYNTKTGNFGQVTFINRPVVGGMYSLLALLSAPTNPYVTPIDGE